MASRLAVDRSGRRVVIQTSCDEIGLRVGERFLLIGNTIDAGAPGGIGWLGHSGQAPTPTPETGPDRAPVARQCAPISGGFQRITADTPAAPETLKPL